MGTGKRKRKRKRKRKKEEGRVAGAHARNLLFS